METGDQVAVVTGASRGLGAGVAEELARLGVRLGLCSRSAPALPAGEAVVAERLDVTDEAALRRFANRVAERFGAIGLWINNAGVTGPLGPLRDAAAGEIAATVSVNLLGVVHGTRAYVDHLRARGARGVLVNVSSGAGRMAMPGFAMYCATKAAVDRLSECVQQEEADAGLRVFSVAPGLIETAMQEQIRGMADDRLPGVAWFREVKRREAFSSTAFVARQLHALAFGDPEAWPDEVCIELEHEHELP